MSDDCEWCLGTGEGYTPDSICFGCHGSGAAIADIEDDDPDNENERRAEWAREDNA